MEWKQKLIKAQKDYADAQTALKAKDKELEDAKFKPKSFQRRLQDEIKFWKKRRMLRRTRWMRQKIC